MIQTELHRSNTPSLSYPTNHHPILKQYLWPEAVWTWVNQPNFIISHAIKCILAKKSCNLRTDEPGDAAQQLARSKVGVK